MTYQPVVIGGGNVGWSFLSRTRDAQQEAFNTSSTVVRDTDYFRDNIGAVQSAEELVGDRRLLSVALGAFGLAEDIGNKFFIRKVLEEGTLDEDAFANRLADKRYFALAKAFAFDLSPPNTVLSDFPDDIISSYQDRSFEVAVGNADENMRLALGLERELAALADRNLSEDAAWFTIMGTPPLRSVFEGAFGLPPQTGALEVDRQLEVFRDKSMRAFGTSDPLDLLEPEKQDALVRRFLLRADLTASGGTSSGSVALSLLQNLVVSSG